VERARGDVQAILGLALVCFTAPAETFLREGCQLVPDENRPVDWKLMKHDGAHSELNVTHEDALSFARTAAEAFGVGESRGGMPPVELPLLVDYRHRNHALLEAARCPDSVPSEHLPQLLFVGLVALQMPR
jgi:hypothetical protein